MGPEPYEDDLERGLAAAFGPPSTRSSVLRALAALTGAEPADLGRAEVGEDDEGRYRVLGEIARGGMGVVMRTRDVEIGRDVAMKVLRPELSREPTALRRFVEEAQIGGQLQHPGIVPVYEMGLRADDQAFFTMKLIQGRTLSALLREREDPSVGRRRFLSVFESVCQTVAYAHARGVIHRDLKPANVMVGSFGEVQVVDWGFAKVLGSPEPRREPRAKPTPKAEARVRTVRSGSTEGQSQVGSAMGTPAYMPPEQAYGDGERMDERSDVFALGATLCEILTGEPPYRKQDGNQLVQAAKHRVTGACERLAACGADPELVALAVRCLGTFEERPRDAGEVAQGVGAYLTSVEERARRAEVRAAQETVRAAEERKRRKLTAALAAAVLLLVVGGGGGYALVERARLGRVQANTVAAGRDLQEALRLEERAREGRRVEDWEPAVLAARQANDHSSSAEIDGDVAAEAAGALERIEQARAEAHARATREARDQAMAARVRAAGEVMGHGLHFEEMDREYAAAFAEYGIDPFALEPEEAARRARESAITGDLCAALDDWAVNLQMSGAAGGQRAERLLDVAARADPDPWRAAVRRAGAAGDEAELETLRAAADIEKLDAPSVLLMERSLAATVNREAAIDWLRRAQPHHPGDFWLHLRLGCHLHNEGAGDSREAVGFLRVALAVRPESVEARHYLGLAHQDLGEHEVALALWDQALALKPDYHHLHVHVFESEKALGRLDEALARARRDIADDPQSAPAYWRLGSLLRMRAQFPAALEAFERATEIDPDFAGGWGGKGHALMVMGRKREAVVALEECARLAPWLGQTFVLLGGLYEQLDSPEKAFPAYEQAVRANPAWPRFRAALATALVRAHRPAEGVRHYEEMRALYPRDEALTDFALDLSQALWLEDYDQEARAVAEDALPSMRARVREKPDDVPALVQLGGLLCDSLWEFEEAQEVFRRAVELNPPMWFAHMNLQVACSKDGNPEAAAAALEEAVPRWPRQPQLRRRLGALRLQLGDFEGALEQLNAAVALGLEDPPYQLLRITCLHLGRYEEALQHHLKILDRAQKLMTPGWSYSADEFRAWGETLVELSRRKQALLEGTDALASPREQLQFAYLLQDEYDAPAAMPHYREALEAEPALARAPAPGPAFCWDWQTQAASAAAEAGAALGPKARQLDPAERTSLRAWALANLREALVRADERLAGADPVAGTQVDRMLKALRLQLPRLRYGRFHASLPSGEQAAWQTYWQDVDRVLRRAREAQVAR